MAGKRCPECMERYVSVFVTLSSLLISLEGNEQTNGNFSCLHGCFGELRLFSSPNCRFCRYIFPRCCERLLIDSQVANTHAAPNATALQKIQKSVGQGLNCCTFNGTGHPALTLPIGTLAPAKEDWVTDADADLKLPVGMQIVGKWWDETGLFQIASAWEGAFDWRSR